MADAPERIWVYVNEDADGAFLELIPEGSASDADIEYVRADLAPPAAVVEAMERALRAISDLTALSATYFADKHPALNAKLDARPQEHWYDVLSSHTDEALDALTAWRAGQ